MSTMIIAPEMIAKIAYVANMPVAEMYMLHLSNVGAFNAEYSANEKPCDPAVILDLKKKIGATDLTKTFLENVIDFAALLRYNSDAHEDIALRMEAAMFCVCRVVLRDGFIAYQQLRLQQEHEEFLERERGRGRRVESK